MYTHLVQSTAQSADGRLDLANGRLQVQEDGRVRTLGLDLLAAEHHAGANAGTDGAGDATGSHGSSHRG